MHHSKLFHENGYVYLENFLDKSNCQQYVHEFQKLIDQGLTRKDEHCPLSHSIALSPLFDSLLEQLTPQIEMVTEKKLFPTYSYARWYAPGDELLVHQDRASCEISVTLTLGFEGNPWPIWMGYDQNKINCKPVSMNVGDAVVYKGCDMYHWREKYTEGQWQVQVFLHYVDADGPFKEFKYDKRKGLSHHSGYQNIKRSDFFHLKSAISLEACNKLINQFENNLDKSFDATLIGNKLDKTIRDTKKIQLPVYQSIGATMAGIGIFANQDIWNFNITHANQCEFLRYDFNGHFAMHMDSDLNERNTDEMRKLTCILILNNDFEGGKLYFQNGKEKTYPEQNPGDLIVFPSFLMHGVEPIVSGIRRSIVTWLVGPYWK